MWPYNSLMFGFGKGHKPPVIRCSFCNKPQDRVKKLISNPDNRRVRAYICNECIAVCNGILEEEGHKSKEARLLIDARV